MPEVVKKGKKWAVVEADGTVLSRFDSEEEAVEEADQIYEKRGQEYAPFSALRRKEKERRRRAKQKSLLDSALDEKLSRKKF